MFNVELVQVANLETIYHDDAIKQRKRYQDLKEKFIEKFRTTEPALRYFSCPGRIEIVGNHTDHNNGKVVAMSTNLDTISAVYSNKAGIVEIYSIEYHEHIVIQLSNLKASENDSRTSKLLKVIIKNCLNNDIKIGGFSAVITSSVMNAAGVSSSASFEMLLLMVINKLFNKGQIDLFALARIAQVSENEAWNKTSGLLDQVACAYGGMNSIDFADPLKPVIERIQEKQNIDGLRYLIIPTGEDHAELSKHYSDITNEMKKISEIFHLNSLRELSMSLVLSNKEVFKLENDRAILRAIHYLDENQRVDEIIEAFKANDQNKIFEIITESGDSSWKLLQNNYVPGSVHQKIPLALTLIEKVVSENNIHGGYRVHGGGFAGTVLLVIPKTDVDNVKQGLKDYFLSPVEILSRKIGLTEVDFI